MNSVQLIKTLVQINLYMTQKSSLYYTTIWSLLRPYREIFKYFFHQYRLSQTEIDERHTKSYFVRFFPTQLVTNFQSRSLQPPINKTKQFS